MNTYNNHYFATKIKNSKPTVLADYLMPSNGLGAILMQNTKRMKPRKTKAPPKGKKADTSGWEDSNDNLFPLVQDQGYNDHIVENLLKPLGLAVAVNKSKTVDENYFPMFAFFNRDNAVKLYHTTAELKKDVGNSSVFKDEFFPLFDFYNKYAKKQSSYLRQETRKLNTRAVKQINPRGKLDPTVDDNGVLIPELYLGEGLNFDNTRNYLDTGGMQQEQQGGTGFNPSLHNINLETAYAAY